LPAQPPTIGNFLEIIVRPSTEENVAAMLAIYAHHIQRGLGAFDVEPLHGDDIKRRLTSWPSATSSSASFSWLLETHISGRIASPIVTGSTRYLSRRAGHTSGAVAPVAPVAPVGPVAPVAPVAPVGPVAPVATAPRAMALSAPNGLEGLRKRALLRRPRA
jgi:hypothetical protein